MSICTCGNPSDSFGGLCDRCISLQALGLASSATPQQIESAYRTLVKVWHPDRFPTDQKLRAIAEEKLKEVNAAHDYLLSEAERPSSRREPPPPPQGPPVTSSDFSEPHTTESSETPATASRRGFVMPGIFLRIAFALGTIAVMAILWLGLDALLSSDVRTAAIWGQYKTAVSSRLREGGARLLSNATARKTENALPPAAPPVQNEPAPTQDPASASAHRPVASGPEHIRISGSSPQALPYITAGLTTIAVLSVLGNPTSSSGEKMFYQGSEIDFKNGRVAGWKIDPKSSPIRVKLWPDTPPAPGLRTFHIGSSRSDVIALQGTPTLFSENQFGYGNSFVFFQNGIVTGWKEDPASTRLRVPVH
jgi:hypothetical protein